MPCPLCAKRPAKRACPALRQDICTVCCATKRLVEIACTEDCRYLEASQRHPAAVVKRQIDADLMRAAGLPTRLSDCGVSATILELLAEEANQQWTARFNPRTVGEAELRGLYQSAL